MEPNYEENNKITKKGKPLAHQPENSDIYDFSYFTMPRLSVSFYPTY